MGLQQDGPSEKQHADESGAAVPKQMESAGSIEHTWQRETERERRREKERVVRTDAVCMLPAYQLHRDQRQVGGGSLQTLSANRLAEGPEVRTILLILSNGTMIIFTIQF